MRKTENTYLEIVLLSEVNLKLIWGQIQIDFDHKFYVLNLKLVAENVFKINIFIQIKNWIYREKLETWVNQSGKF